MVRKKIYFHILTFIKIITLILMAFLNVGVWVFTSRTESMALQKSWLDTNNVLLLIITTMIQLVLFMGLTLFFVKKFEKAERILLCIVLGWIMVMGGVLLLFGRSIPQGDAMSVFMAAESFAEGNMAAIAPTDSYFSYYPHQLGLAAFLEVLLRIWNVFGMAQRGFHFVKGIYIILLCVAVLFQYKCCDEIWGNTKINMFYLCIAAANFPMILYASFIYGEIPTFAAFSIGLYCVICFLKEKRQICNGLLSVVFFTLSVMVRKNSIILIIAVCLVLGVEWIKSGKNKILALLLACAIGACSIMPVVQKVYECRADNYLQSGVTALSFVAMGMQEGTGGSGFYNGFNFNTYMESGLDSEVANEISKQAIEERISYFADHLDYAVTFYHNKCWMQWADGTYASLQATIGNLGGRSEVIETLYGESGQRYFEDYGKIYQCMVFFLVLFFCISCMLCQYREERLFVYIGLIGVLGGFLFHMMWEASARYIFSYSLLLMPYAACGLERIDRLLKIKTKRG